MKIVAWNVRGFNNPLKHSEVKSYMRNNNLDIIALLETRVKQMKVIEAQVVSCCVHHFETNISFNVSFVYGSNNADTRLALWDSMRSFAPSGPWMILGDFNVLEDLVSTGCDMTWTNKQEPEARGWSKLDRVLINPAWLSSFPTSYAGQIAKAKLVQCQQNLQLGPFSSELIQEEKTWLQECSKFKTVELNILKQRAKIKHIQLSDSWTKYVFAKISERQHQQVIGTIKDRNGVDQHGLDKVGLAFQDYYQHLLGSTAATVDFDNSPPGPTVTDEEKLGLIQPISTEEIRVDVFSMDFNSSPGIDGFSAGFFKSAWNIIATHFCKAVQSFFRIGKLAKQANSTILSLMPKKDTPSSVMDFRPISCCTVFYKTFIKWILGCIISTWCSLKINGGLTGFFPGKSGLRQGDPLSPDLFVLSMKILSRSLRTLCQQGSVSFNPKCCQFNLTHLIFADDLMVFVRGDVPSVKAVKKALTDFALLSGLHANMDKTSIFFGGVSQDIKTEILAATGFTIEETAALLNVAPVGLWARWHQYYVLKTDSIWSLPSKTQYSASLKGILTARDFLITHFGSIQIVKDLLESWGAGGKLQANIVYDHLLQIPDQEDWHSVLSHSSIVPSHKLIAILAAQGKLATVDNLQLRGFQLANRCCLCKQDVETHQHLFFRCSFSQTVWSGLQQWQKLTV
ncbi:uncharacterized protein LOC141607544 [Silene latifolia]|uniref:uncharacterized protein LOC141607544 n=1 Tax=Silene latifolia TaxID=37657 RepID=UPI003D776241